MQCNNLKLNQTKSTFNPDGQQNSEVSVGKRIAKLCKENTEQMPAVHRTKNLRSVEQKYRPTFQTSGKWSIDWLCDACLQNIF